eukprot:CAMPEP_0174232108 /NCGR_PEP_ID=MMETSP0417-20130205/2481_1 /TAXON_ID=242541 /ORGANISM="Mayorella sp, Strain BSH-02190019" /LENGTH=382 /DNA_ID=CAMNT_0015310101 /DNA_START=52 /DNA_END=1197 /DNA_ORIENTATION=-
MADTALQSLIHAIAGAVGGMLSLAVTFPLLTITTRLQVSSSSSSKASSKEVPTSTARTNRSSSQFAYSGTLDAFRSILRKEGVGALYSGLTPALFGVAVTNAVYYYWYSYFRNLATQRLRSRHGFADARLSALSSLLIAAAAGTITSLVTNPIWVVTVRMQTTKKKRKNSAHTKLTDSGKRRHASREEDRLRAIRSQFSSGFRQSVPVIPRAEHLTRASGAEDADAVVPVPSSSELMSTISEIWNQDGIRGFYSGIVPSLALVSNPAIQYMSFEKLRDALFHVSGGQRVTPGGTFLLGAISKTLATVCTYPYILIKSRLQSRDSTNGEHYTGTLDVIRKMAARDGLASFYSGLSSKLVQSVATSALLFFTKDQLVSMIGLAL